MKNFILTASVVALLSNFSHAEEGALLGIPGKVIFESKFDSELPKDWQSAKGKWEIVEGAMRGSEKPEDMHGAVNRMPGSSEISSLNTNSSSKVPSPRVCPSTDRKTIRLGSRSPQSP
jgi:hypothetical protein